MLPQTVALWVQRQLQRFLTQATGYLKNMWVWGVCRPPGIVGMLAHVFFVGRRPSAFLHPKGACDPKPVSIAFLSGARPPSPTALSGGLAAVPPRDGPALVFLSPSALEGASPHSETCRPPGSTWALDQVHCLAPTVPPCQDGPGPLGRDPGPPGAQRSNAQSLSPLQASHVKWGNSSLCRVGRGNGQQQAWCGSRTSLGSARFPLPGHQGSVEGKAQLCAFMDCVTTLLQQRDVRRVPVAPGEGQSLVL